MCGIAGVRRSAAAEGKLAAMLAMLQHRGPDDEGEFKGREWRLGMRRLSIIDLDHGRQPMQSANGEWVLVLNGEIYNYRSLRKRLSDLGHRFRTQSDTEALLEVIARDGVPAACSQIEGMFAFAALHIPSDELWLARDRFGEKPLFLDRRHGFAFCSELAPLLESGEAEMQIEGKALAGMFRFGFPLPGTTPVRGVTELEPSHWLLLRADGSERAARYFHLPSSVDNEPGDEKSVCEKILASLDSSVQQRLVADVPLGLFLSGGIDSAAVAASAAAERKDVRAVTVGFETRKYDERPLARKTASRLGIHLDEEVAAIPPYDASYFDGLLRHYGQPFEDTSAVPTRAVSHAARRHFKVVLSGDGGDELFGGYISHARDRRLRHLGGGKVGAAASELTAKLLPSARRFENLKRAFRLNASRPKGLLPFAMAGVMTDGEVLGLFHDTSHHEAAAELLSELRDESFQLWELVKDSTLAVSLYHIRYSMPQDILMKVDRMSMAESLEVRAPFLDSKLATYALSLPARLKVRDGQGKYILRRALRDRLPLEVLEAPKHGFNLPVRQWLGEEFWRDLRDEAEHGDGNEINLAALRRMIELDHAHARSHNSYRALHRSVLLFTYLRWKRCMVSSGRTKAERCLAEKR